MNRSWLPDTSKHDNWQRKQNKGYLDNDNDNDGILFMKNTQHAKQRGEVDRLEIKIDGDKSIIYRK